MGERAQKRNLFLGRFIADCLVGGAVLYAHWVTVVVMVIACILFFRRWYEAIIAGFFMDMLFGTPVPIFGGFPLVFTASFIVLYLVITYLKKQVRSYDASY